MSRAFAGLSPRWWLALAYATTVTTLAAAAYLARLETGDGTRLGFGRAAAWQACVYGSWAALVPPLAWVGRRTRLGDAPWLASAARYTAISLVVVPAHAALTAWTSRLLGPPAGMPSIVQGTVARLPVDLLLYWGIVGVLFATSYHAAMLARERAAGQLEAALVRAELHALRAQLEPHFLFNALQSISALIPRDPAAAQVMTARLGDLLRTTLRRIGVADVTLAEELELLGHYIAIEQVRFGDRLQVVHDIDDDAIGCLVPDLLLQPLVENAVRHGIGSMASGGTVRILARRDGARLTLTIADDGAGLPAEWREEPSSGLGLRLTRERLQYAFGEAGTFRIGAAPSGGTIVELGMPVRTR